MSDRTTLISGEQWVNSLKNLGITTTDAICELVDNSIDASARNIHITIQDVDKKKITFIIEDDGEGIPAEKLDKILAFGGRLQSKNSTTIGKFGWGLSSSITCQTNRGEVYSKVKGAKQYHYCYIDLNELSREKTPLLPLTTMEDPTGKYSLQLNGTESGTIVVLKTCDVMDLEWHSKDKLASALMKTLGETYRKYINGGISILVNGKAVKLIDPLLLMPNSLHADKYDKSELYSEIEVDVKDVIDPDTGKEAKVRIKLAMLQPTVTKVKNADEEVKTGIANQGFYLMRHNRQIGRAQTMDLYTRNAHFNFLRGEISFPSCLDKYFGIQTNKCRFSLKEGIRDTILESMKGIIPQMELEYRKKQTELKSILERHKIKESERIAAEAIKVMRKPKFLLPEKEVKKYEDERRTEKDEDIKRIELDPALKVEEKELLKKEIENEFQIRMPFKMKLKHIETGDFYIVHPVGNGQVEVFINTAHPFFTKVYERAQQENIATYIDLLIFTLAKAEVDFWDVDTKKFYDVQKSTWSTYLSTFLEYSK